MNDERKRELQKQIEKANEEILEIDNDARKEANLNAVGKCFSKGGVSEDFSEVHILYMKVTRVDDVGNCWGYYIKIFNKGILFSFREVALPDILTMDAHEIEPERFDSIYNYQILKIQGLTE